MTNEWKLNGRLFNKWLFAVGKRFFMSINGNGFFAISVGKSQKAGYKKAVI